MFNPQWFSASDDLACKHEPYVFRLHKNLVALKEDHRSQYKEEIKAYDLQFRKIENSDFKNLGNIFFLKRSYMDYLLREVLTRKFGVI